MAKIKGPLHSISASGTLASSITFLRSAQQQNAKSWNRPARRASVAQLARQKKYRGACLNWHITTVQTDYDWPTIAAPRKITLFNAYISECMSGRLIVPGSIWDGGLTTWDSGLTFFDQL